MHDVSRLRRTIFDDFMKPLNVTRSQWWVLAYLSRHDGMIQSDLANVLELGKAALGSLIDRLEAAGLVRRGADDSDRRAKRVYLSPAGSQLIKEMQRDERAHPRRRRRGIAPCPCELAEPSEGESPGNLQGQGRVLGPGPRGEQAPFQQILQ